MKHWIVKSEEDVYSIDDLKRDKVTHWDGVRNYQARNYLREMAKGDTVLYYHSNCETPGVVGVARVAKTAYPDPSQYDKKSEYFDQKATLDAPRWFCPDLQYVHKFKSVVALEDLKSVPALKEFQLIKRGNRLSVMPVAAAHFRLIEKMAEN